MKKVAIFSNNLQLGGVQKSLINLLNAISGKYEIHLYLLDKDNELLPFVPKNVIVEEIGYPLRLMGISHNTAKEESFFRGLQSFILRGVTRICGKKFVVPYIVNSTKCINEEFDVAISYVHDGGDKSFYGGCNEFVLKRVKAKRKFSFMHGDFLKCGSNTAYNVRILAEFDKIICVSRYCAESMRKSVPSIKDKVTYVPNFINYDEIIRLANDNPKKYDSTSVNLVTIARLSKEKGLTRVLPALRQIIDSGIKVKWYIVGDGAHKDVICKEIEKEKLTEEVVLLGKQTNPYKFVLNADLFVLPSYEEAEGMVIKEAIGLGVPVLSTDTGATKDILLAKFGFICNNNDKELSKVIIEVIGNRNLIETKRSNLRCYKPNNSDSEMRIQALIEGTDGTN